MHTRFAVEMNDITASSLAALGGDVDVDARWKQWNSSVG